MAQEPLFKKYTQENGLPSANPYSIIQDSTGFLWICTTNGVCRFDGHHAKNFTPQNSLVDFGSFHLFLDSKQRLWVISIFSAPVYYEHNQFHVCKGIDNAAIAGTRWLTEDSKGNLYFLTINGTIIKWDGANSSRTLQIASGITGGELLNDTTLLVTAGNIIYKITNFQKVQKLPLGGFTYEYNRFYKIKENLVIAATGKGLYQFTNGGYRLIWEYGKEFSSVSYCLHAENDSTFWIGSKEGLFIFHYSANHLELVKKLLPGKAIYSILKDHSGNYWIGASDDAIYFLNAANAIYYDLPEIKANIIKILFTANCGYVFTTNGDLYAIQNNKLEYIGPFTPGNSKLLYLKAVRFSNDAIFISFRGNKGAMLKNERIDILNAPFNFNVANYYYRKDGMFFAIGGIEHGVGCKMMNNDSLIKTTTVTAELNWSKNFCVDLTGRYWTAVNDTLYWTDTLPGNKPIVNKYFEKGVFISDIDCDRDNVIWVATRGGGVYCLKGRKITAHYNIANGMLTNNCASIYIDDSDNVWVCTENGLNEIQKTKNNYSIRSFTKDNLLPDNGVNTVYRKGNTVYVGTCKGMVLPM